MNQYDEEFIDVRAGRRRRVKSGTPGPRANSRSPDGKRNPMASNYTTYVVFALLADGSSRVAAFGSRVEAMRQAKDWAREDFAVFVRQSTFNRYVEQVREGLAELAAFILQATAEVAAENYGAILTSFAAADGEIT